MSNLSEEITYYDEIRSTLEADHFGHWVVIHDRKVVGFFASFETAAATAVEQFGRGPYLIRQIGAPSAPMPASVMYGPLTHAHSALRV